MFDQALIFNTNTFLKDYPWVELYNQMVELYCACNSEWWAPCPVFSLGWKLIKLYLFSFLLVPPNILVGQVPVHTHFKQQQEQEQQQQQQEQQQ